MKSYLDMTYRRELATPKPLATKQQKVCQFEKHTCLEWVLVHIFQ
jgi:hypothetical protein